MANKYYDEDYEVDPSVRDLNTADYVIKGVMPIRNGERISGFLKISNPAEITQLHDENVIGYDPDHQRGWRIVWREGEPQNRKYLIKKDKVKAIAQRIAENKEYNRFRTVNCRKGHVGLFYKAHDPNGIWGDLYIFRESDSTEFNTLLSKPDSAHRQEGDQLFVKEIASSGPFSPDHMGFTPETYDLILHITLTDAEGEGESHYEHNELITKSAATRRDFLEAGQTLPQNWIVHELMTRDAATKDLVEVYEKSISKNSPKLVTFSTLSKGIAEGWKDWLTEHDKEEAASQIHDALKMVRQEVREWGPLPFSERRNERETFLYSQAIVIRALLRVFADLHRINMKDDCVGDWDRWRPVFRQLKQDYKYEKGDHMFTGEFLSRQNPLFYAEEGGGIYQLNKGARERKEACELEGKKFHAQPLIDLTVQNTRLSLDYMFGALRSYLGYAKKSKSEPVAAK